MSGRGRVSNSRHGIDPRRLSYPYNQQPPGPYSRGPGPLRTNSYSSDRRVHLLALDEELERRLAERRVLLADREVLGNDRLALQRQLVDSKEELHRCRLVVEDIKNEKEKYIRDLLDKGRRLERDLKENEFIREDVQAMRVDRERYNKGRMDLEARIEYLKENVSMARAEKKQISALREELDKINQELFRTRNGVEVEKKANMEMVEQRTSMEKNMVKMAREIDKLRADLANTEARPWVPSVGGPYGTTLGSPQTNFPPSYPQLGFSERGSMYGTGSDHNLHPYR